MKYNGMVFLLVALVILAETGVALIMLNARHDAPFGFWLWFGAVGIVAPIFALWMYWRTIGRKAG